MRSTRSEKWSSRPIIRNCEVYLGRGRICGRPTEKAYPAMGYGWMALCEMHAEKHPEATSIKSLLKMGEKLEVA